MSLAKNFKKDVFYYLLGVIIPCVVNFISIPYFKNLLGNSNYTYYSLLITALLLVNTISIGWIGQSIIRLKSTYIDVPYFLFNSWLFSIIIQAIICFLSFAIVLYLYHNWEIAFFFSATLLLGGAYQILIAITQANLNAWASTKAEALRALLLFIGGALYLSYYPTGNAVAKLLVCHTVSFFIPSIYLFKINAFTKAHFFTVNKDEWIGIVKKLYQYGILLSFWFLISYLIVFIDRYLLNHLIKSDSLGLYIAQFDLIYKSILMIAAPVMTALLPIVAHEFENGDSKKVSIFLNKILYLMFASLIIALGLYYFVGYDLLKTILKLPANDMSYKWSGLFIISGSIVWYMALIVHKKFELRKQLLPMLYSIIASFLILLIVDLFVLPKMGITGAGIGFVASTSSYLLFVTLLKVKKLETDIAC